MKAYSLLDVLADIARAASTRVSIESIPAPDLGARGQRYRIVGITADDVQRQITRLMDEVEEGAGQGGFAGPVKVRSGPDAGLYEAEGFTQFDEMIVVEVA